MNVLLIKFLMRDISKRIIYKDLWKKQHSKKLESRFPLLDGKTYYKTAMMIYHYYYCY